MFTTPWNTVHLKQGDVKPEFNQEIIVVYAMRFCPYAERAMLTLIEKDLNFSVVNINLTSKPAWFLELNPAGSVPVVEYKGEVVTGSLEASLFLDQIDGENQKPLDSVQDEKAQKIIGKSSEALDILYKIIGFGEENQTPKERKQRIQDISDILAFFEYELLLKEKDPTFFGGESPNLTDLMIWPLFERLPMLPILYPEEKEDLRIISRHRTMSHWVENMKNISAVKRYSLKPETLAKFYKVFAKDRKLADYDFIFRELSTNQKYLEDIK
eukprot:GFUD01032991.1.p1 GENE.GFUD01032991.1~~GFUD01032991.1.p1  ORF type:complete len:270 (-),score=73.22 GFUD01032991.1:20-829(-)